jgi:hypothetical protein
MRSLPCADVSGWGEGRGHSLYRNERRKDLHFAMVMRREDEPVDDGGLPS